jgi:hypothetical protein
MALSTHTLCHYDLAQCSSRSTRPCSMWAVTVLLLVCFQGLAHSGCQQVFVEGWVDGNMPPCSSQVTSFQCVLLVPGESIQRQGQASSSAWCGSELRRGF